MDISSDSIVSPVNIALSWHAVNEKYLLLNHWNIYGEESISFSFASLKGSKTVPRINVLVSGLIRPMLGCNDGLSSHKRPIESLQDVIKTCLTVSLKSYY